MQLRPLPFAAGRVFTLIFWIAFVIWTLPEVFAWKAKRSVDSSSARDQGSLRLIVALWCSGIALDFSLSLFLPQAAISWTEPCSSLPEFAYCCSVSPYAGTL